MALREGFYKFGHWDNDNENVEDHGLVLAEGGKLTILEDPKGYLKHLFKGGTIPLDHAEQIMKSVNRNHYALFSYSDDADLYDKYEEHLHPKHPFFKSDALGTEPKLNIRGIAENYMSSKGLTLSHPPKVRVNEQRAKKIASAYHEMKHDPEHPQVKRAYHALKQETLDQFRHLQQNGLKISRIKPDQENPYKTSKDLMQDIHQNHHLWFFPTEQGFGSAAGPNNHPLLEPTGMEHEGKPLLYNDVFRIVHDYFGHVKEGHGFGPQGEENAWHNHMEMYSPEAQKALTTETRGQNSWVNFGPHGEHNRKNPGQTIYADQKAGLLPDWAMEHHPDDIAKADIDELDDSVEKSKNVREQRAKIFGTDANAPRVSEKRLKMMRILRDYAKKQYGLSMVTAEGKRDESGQLKEEADYTHVPYDVFSEEGLKQEAALRDKIKQEIHAKMQTPEGRRLTDIKAHLAEIKEKHGERPASAKVAEQKRLLLAEKKSLAEKLQLPKRTDPKPDWKSGNLETQPSPDAAVHEIAHLNLAPEGMTPAQFQTEMDVRWGESQKKYGHMQQKKTQGEIQPMSIENPIRRELGLPANQATKPVKRQEYALDDPSQPRFVEGKNPEGETAFYDRQSRLQSPETKERMQQIREGSLKFNPEKGWEKASDTNALVNLRARGLKEEADTRARARFSARLGKSEDIYESMVWDRVYEIESALNKSDGTQEDLSQHHGKDVFVYFNLHKKVWSIKDRKTGLVIAHAKKVAVDAPQFKVSEAGRQRVLRDKAKNVHAGVVGKLNAHHTDFDSEGKKRVSYNPYKYNHFYESDTQAAVHSADHVTLHVEDKQGPDGKQVRIPHVYAKNPTSNAVVKSDKEKIPGGLSSGKKPEDFDQEQLAAGIKVEMEHTTDKAVATEIAMDHLSEDPNYYKKLKAIEKSEVQDHMHLWSPFKSESTKTVGYNHPVHGNVTVSKEPGTGKMMLRHNDEHIGSFQTAGEAVRYIPKYIKSYVGDLAPHGPSWKAKKSESAAEDVEKGLKEAIVGAAMAGALAGGSLHAGTPASHLHSGEIGASGDHGSVSSSYPLGKAPSYKHLKPGEILTSHRDPKHFATERHYEKSYNLPSGLISSIRLAGERSDWHQSSNHNTKSPYQFTSKTKDLYSKKYKVDAHKDTDSAIHATALHLKESIRFVDKKFKPKTEHKRAVLAAKHFHGGPSTNEWGPVNRAYGERIGKGLKELRSNPSLTNLDHIFDPKRSVASESDKIAKAKKIAEIAKSLVLEKIGQMTHNTQPMSVGYDVFQKDLEAAMGSFAVDTGGIRSFNDKKKEDDRTNSLDQVPPKHKKKFETAMKDADLEGQVLNKLTSLKKKLKR